MSAGRSAEWERREHTEILAHSLPHPSACLAMGPPTAMVGSLLFWDIEIKVWARGKQNEGQRVDN